MKLTGSLEAIRVENASNPKDRMTLELIVRLQLDDPQANLPVSKMLDLLKEVSYLFYFICS